MTTTTIFIFTIFMLVFGCQCQMSLEAPYDPATVRDVDSYKVKEWQRFLDFHRKKMKQTFEKIKKLKNKKYKFKKSEGQNKKVSPNFILSRTQDGFVVKQLEPGSQPSGNGGFEFPLQPALLTNIKYNYDGSVAPFVKLSETKNGVVSKRLEYGYAPNPGVNWKTRSGSSKSILKEKKIKDIDENGVINKDAGVNKNFPVGEITLRGTLKVLNASKSLKENDVNPIELIAQDDGYETETEQYAQNSSDDESFETENNFYDYDSAVSNEDDEENEDDSGNWDDTNLKMKS